MVEIISSGSKGNAVLYGGCVLVDCGVSFSKLVPFLKQIKIVLLTHCHKDHFNMLTINKLQKERPTVRIASPVFLSSELTHLKNIDVIEIGKLYDYKTFKISAVKLYHDVPNVGWRIFIANSQQPTANSDYKIFHATDTQHLEGITANGYDLYALEHNYCEEKIALAKEVSYREGTFTHAFGSEKTHLSKQQAQRFFSENAHQNSQLIELHKSTTFY